MTGSVLLDQKKAGEASSKLRLSHISLTNMEAHTRAAMSGAPLHYDVAHRPAIWNPLPEAVVSIFGVSITIDEGGAEARTRLADIDLAYRVEYVFDPSYKPADEALLEHYIGIVGRLHVWPYIRAEVQHLSAKLGLPPLTLPSIVSGDTVHLASQRWRDPDAPREPNGAAPQLSSARPAKRAAKKAKRRK